MKKKYSKPVIIFDSFELSQSIAGHCQVIANVSSGVCGMIDDESGWKIFSSGMPASVCKIKAGNSNSDAEWYSLCYEIPSGNYNLFSS